MKILITGGCGQCGSALTALPHQKVFLDREGCVEILGNSEFVQGDLGDITALQKAMSGCNAVVHLAAASSPSSPWDEVLRDNIIGTQNVLEAARKAGVERVVFGSTNHVVGMHEVENAPEIYGLGPKIVLTRSAEPHPDSLYGVSKLYGEHLGRFYAETGGPKFYALRIGSLVWEDHPFAHAERGVLSGEWKRNSPKYDLMVQRLKCLWISKRDFVQIVDLCLSYDALRYDTFYAVSNNPRRWLDIEYARSALGYVPQDNAENWTEPPKAG